MQSPYLAHTSSSGEAQLLRDHLSHTSQLCAKFSAAFDAQEQGTLAGMAHDIGKYSDAFQRRLAGSSQRVDHSTAGAAECIKLRQPYAAFAVAGHHGGLPNGGSRTDPPDSSTFLSRMNRAMTGKLEDYSAWKQEISLPSAALPNINKGDALDEMFFIRMLYSCLTDADFLDTEKFMTGKQRTSSAPSIETLVKKLDDYCEGWFPPKTVLNQSRCQILRRCQQQGKEQSPGLFTLTIPTGGGKTVASLAFALHHAHAHQLERVIYVVPYTSIIEQNAAVFRRILGEDAVLEHHSGVQYDVGPEATPHSINMAQATENWDIPVVVTTAVQFFESLFSNRSSQCRKLHHLARSVIIFDEAQMLPMPYLQPCIYAISQLVKYYHTSAVLCTATQPALKEIFQQFLPQVSPVEICPPDTFPSEVFARTTFQRVGELSWDVLSSALMEHNQVLCIVNTRKSAQTIFSGLEPEGAFHLSTLMYPAHRKKVLEEIRHRLKESLPCRVVSTSLIEAGVDVDFPVVFREEAGLDSILQAAGRCNREGKRPLSQSVITIFRSPTPPPPLFSRPIGAGREALGKYENPASKEAIEYYFHHLLVVNGPQAQDQYEILPLIKSGSLPFETIAQNFHLIDSSTQTLYIPLEEGASLIEQLRSGKRSRELFRKLNQYSVSIYPGHLQTLYNAGDVEFLEDSLAVLTNLSLYSSVTGLSLEADTGKCLFI